MRWRGQLGRRRWVARELALSKITAVSSRRSGGWRALFCPLLWRRRGVAVARASLSGRFEPPQECGVTCPIRRRGAGAVDRSQWRVRFVGLQLIRGQTRREAGREPVDRVSRWRLWCCSVSLRGSAAPPRSHRSPELRAAQTAQHGEVCGGSFAVLTLC